MTIIIIPLSHHIKSNIKRIWKLNELARKFKLFFYKQDVVGSKLIGLDVIKRKLLYFQKGSKKTSCIVIDLANFDGCSLKKQYSSIEAGGLKKRKLHEYLKAVFLEISFKNRSKVITLPFFEKEKDKLVNVQELELKAKEWEAAVSKLLQKKLEERA